MPWITPTLAEVRGMIRDSIRAKLPGADALIPNSVLRVLSDNQGAQCHTVLQYVDWLALQLLPDSAEAEWLDRHGDIWLTNADGSTGRKMATLAEGTVEMVGAVGGTIVPVATRLLASSTTSAGAGISIEYETLEGIVTAEGEAPVPCRVRALDPGAIGNRTPGDGMAISGNVQGNISSVIVVDIGGGTDTENDDDLRIRVLQRIRQPPMGGATHDYVRWALAVPGCTRAWCAPLEMGIGTVSVRVMFDELRAENDGFPYEEDLDAVREYIDTVRPVAVKDFWVLSPIKQFIDVKLNRLNPDNTETRAAIEVSLLDMLLNYAAPGQTIFAVWKAQAIMNTVGVISFDLVDWDDDVMPSKGHMATLGDIVYGPGPVDINPLLK
jgi:uncharacterized phage protein gp47/JayE